MLDRFKKSLASATLVALLASAPMSAHAQNVPPEGYRFVGDCELQIFFATGVTTLTPEQSAAIDRFIADAETDVYAVRGYASTTGNPQTNAALAQARAQTAVLALATEGVTGVRVFSGQTGDGPEFQRDDILRDECAGAVVEARVEPGTGMRPGIGAGLGLLLLLGLAGAGGSSDGTN
ncbi:OmpA family protein [Rhodobacterales bacterium HKCCSP123]|nr:OmpA family protein [Rhodobacterales bacterium HKCCSP123]